MLKERERKKRELKQHKICLEPPNLIYTTNRERKGQKTEGKRREE